MLEQLTVHGVKPTPDTPPEFVREFLNDLYRYELRRLRDRYLAKEFPKREYRELVTQIRLRYRLLALKPAHWTE